MSIAIVVPTYNSEKYISECLASIDNQTYQDIINLYIIDDASNDNTMNIVNSFSFREKINVTILQNPQNMKQGYSRNTIIKMLKEKYVLFLDSDDFIDRNCLALALSNIEENSSDFVMIDWIYYDDINKEYSYKMNNQLLYKHELRGNECADILALNTYFSTPIIYNTLFLQKNNIRFGEGYIYEDFEFIVQCAMSANKISFLHTPLYTVRINDRSTTKTNYHSSVHVDALKCAVSASLTYLQPRSDFAIYYFYRYVLAKSLNYTSNRAPIFYQYSTIKSILKMLSVNKSYQVPDKRVNINRFIFNNRIIENNSALKLIAYNYKLRLKKHIKDRKNNSYNNKIVNNRIVFVGFDFKFEGNSKYLYENIDKNYFDVYFITEDKAYSKEYYYLLSSAKIIIMESWNKLKYTKQEGQYFIQLWHGSPIKKMLFSTTEKYILKHNRHNRMQKFNDYKQWNYLLVDNLVDQKYFDKCFIKHQYQYLNFGYPRVKYLIDNKDNKKLIAKLKKKYNIDRPLILYVPTWRDIKLENDRSDYLVDIEKLRDKFPSYQFLSLEHSYLSNGVRNDDIQELLLCSDIVVSDYSSIIYDAFAISKKVLLCQKDINEYSTYRGIFNDRLIELSSIICYNEDDLIDLICNIDNIEHIDIKNDINHTQTIVKFEKLFKQLGADNG